MSDEPPAEEVNAPLAELRVASALRRYERLKLGLQITVLVVLLAMGGYLIGIARSNRETLVILKCAVARSTSIDEHGKPRTPEGSRAAFEKCVHQ